MKPITLVVVLLALTGSTVQKGLEEHTTLIVPIYNQTREYVGSVSMIEAQGRKVWVLTEEFMETGQLVQDGRELIEENSVGYLRPVYDISGHPPPVGDGWARLFVPENRQIHAEFSVSHQRERGQSASFIAVPPAKVFRLWGRYWFLPPESGPEQNTDIALSIVNPTDAEQTVIVTFHRTYPRDSDGEPPTLPRTIQGGLKIPAMHRMSRFLAELVPIREKFPEEFSLRGVVRIEGETEIAVAALQYYWNIPYFRGIPVSAEPIQDWVN